MANQIVISSGAKVRNLNGVLTGTTGVVNSLGINVANGIPQLDGSGKILVSQLPNSVMEYKGTWNAATNTPTLANGTGNQGDVYLCSTAGTVNFGAGAITFAVGDQVIYSGTIWQKAGGSTGTVTSVAVTESGDALTITGSPITTSGTINIGFAGTTGQYVNGAGGLTTFPSLTNFVPYTGATSNVALGEFGLSAGYIGLDTTPTSTPTSVGTLSWDTTYLTPKVITGVGDTTLQIGQEEVILVHNNTGSTLTDGQVVYVTGSTGELPSVSLADASSETTSAATLGVVTESIANGTNGFITISGLVHGLNTLAFNEGDLLWLSETAGAFTNVKPISPAHLVLIGYVIKKAGGNGSILVKIQNTQELEECSDVLFTSLANNNILAYESSTDLWKNKTIAAVLGYTPQAQLTLTTTGTSGAATLTGATLNIPNYTTDLSNYVTLNGIQTITGEKTFANNTLKLAANGGLVTYLSNISGTGLTSSGSNALGFNINNDLYFAGSDKVGGVFSFNNTAVRTYTLQNANGTLAFTSDIPTVAGVYLPLAGGTLTGALNINLSGSTGLNVASDGVVFRSNTGIGAPRQIVLSSGGGPTALIEAKGYGASYNTDLSIKTYNSSGTGFDVFFATSAGNVGIGTSSPSTILDIVGTFRTRRTADTSQYIDVYANGGEGYIDAVNSASGTSQALVFRNGNSGGTTERMRITSGGNVGIGTSSPQSILVIRSASTNDSLSVESQVTITNTASGYYSTLGFRSVDSDGDHGRAGISVSKDSGSVSGLMNFIVRKDSGSFINAMKINSGGVRVINGTKSDTSANFIIASNETSLPMELYFQRNQSVSYHIQAVEQGISYRALYLNPNGGAVYAGGVRLDTLSDKRVKDNIQPIQGALSKVLAITGKKFHLKDEEDGKLRYGFIAQELEGVLDEFVVQTSMTFKKDDLEVENVKSIENWASSWAALLVEAIKEQQAQIEELKAKLK